jgi:hypothetical protein
LEIKSIHNHRLFPNAGNGGTMRKVAQRCDPNRLKPVLMLSVEQEGQIRVAEKGIRRCTFAGARESR